MNIISDVAGRYDELLELLKKMPDEECLFVGDLNDRGTQSKQVIEFVMQQGHKCLLSNHGDMLVAIYNHFKGTKFPTCSYDIQRTLDSKNGCMATLESYLGVDNIPIDQISWLSSREWYHQEKGLFVSHAPWAPYLELQQVCMYQENNNLLWNRQPPKPRDFLQIYGHNHRGEMFCNLKKEPYAICIDNTEMMEITGIHWPSLEVFSMDYQS